MNFIRKPAGNASSISPKLNAKKRLFTDLSPHKDYSEIIGRKT